jgi:peptide deformylase
MADEDVEVEREEDAPPIEELDEETRARRDAALSHVRKLGDPALRAKALPVERFDAALAAEIEQMGELMHDALGVGLAATQLGVLHRVLVYRTDPEEPVTALVNPQLESSSEETEVAQEGCLSIPGVHVDVERALRVGVSANDAAGAPLELEAEGLEARVIQHEIDHLDGILMIDRISKEQRRDAMRALREGIEPADHAERAAATPAHEDTEADAGRRPAGAEASAAGGARSAATAEASASARDAAPA